ncbi:hypothetical protein GE09DRAFT_765325 [Coniochaeta sp. 2T2.1]|nr:hypothetical protein GE09DRAFT_765325 [Coniochaeta sp. 2T2.1]
MNTSTPFRFLLSHSPWSEREEVGRILHRFISKPLHRALHHEPYWCTTRVPLRDAFRLPVARQQADKSRVSQTAARSLANFLLDDMHVSTALTDEATLVTVDGFLISSLRPGSQSCWMVQIHGQPLHRLIRCCKLALILEHAAQQQQSWFRD